MKNLLKSFLVVVFFVVCTHKANAQKFTTHAVKNGETLQHISTTYGVSQDVILQYNKEVKKGVKLRANTILVIPLAAPKAALENKTPVNKLHKEALVDSVTVREPYGFVEYTVNKKETLYGIAKRFNVTEEEIKKYNKELYATQLKKKMVLRIPKYKKVEKVVHTVDPDDYEKYIVAPKETRWSIANKYGITIDSMLALNPNLSQTSNYLAEGYELVMPKIAGSTVDNQKTQLYISYTVPAKMNFYRLEKEFGINSDEIVRLNPEIVERGGLKEGMVIRLPENKVDPGEINTDNYIFYEVKPKQNEFRLTRKFGLSWKELIALNPNLKDGLKAGMVLKLPIDHAGDFEVRNSLVLDKVNLLDSINTAIRPKLLFLLPFRLDKLDLSDKEKVERTMQNRNSLKWSLGLYSGALVALDSIKELGVSVDVKTFDNRLDLLYTKGILSKEMLSEYNAIFGPLDMPSLKEVAVQAAKYDIPVIAPVPAKSNISLDNVFYSYTNENLLRDHMIKYVKDNSKKENIIIIADEKNRDVKGVLKEQFINAKVVQVREESKNIGINRDRLASLLSKDEENWIFVESDNFKLISSIVSILNAFNNSLLDLENNNHKLKVRMFTTDKNNAFDDEVISRTHLSNLKFTYPSVYREVNQNSFVNRYRKKFGDDPDMFAVRGFDITYDLLLKLAYKNDLFDISKFIGQTEYNGNRFDYEKDATSGYFNKASYIMTYDNMHIKELE